MAASTNLSSIERTLRAKLASHEGWANTADRTARAAPGHKASPAAVEYWLDKVDPDALMTDEARWAAATSKRQAYMTRLSFKGAKARRLKSEAS